MRTIKFVDILELVNFVWFSTVNIRLHVDSNLTFSCVRVRVGVKSQVQYDHVSLARSLKVWEKSKKISLILFVQLNQRFTVTLQHLPIDSMTNSPLKNEIID